MIQEIWNVFLKTGNVEAYLWLKQVEEASKDEMVEDDGAVK